MQHIAKNVVMVHEGRSKHVVSSLLHLCGVWDALNALMIIYLTDGEKEILQQ